MKKILLSFILASILNITHAQWQLCNGPYGGSISVTCITTSGSNIFAGTNNGVYLSTNNGVGWSEVNTGFPVNNSINCIATSGSNIYAGTNNALYLSTNNGTSWSAISNASDFNGYQSNQYPQCIAISGSNIIVGSGGGVFLTTNNGKNWETLSNVGVNSIVINGDSIITVNGNSVQVAPINGSSSAITVSDGIINNSINTVTLKGDTIFCGLEMPSYNGNLQGGVNFSTNNGRTWTSDTLGIGNLSVNILATSGSNIYAGTNNGAYLSINNGYSWSAVNTGLQKNANITALAITGNSNFAGTSNGIYLSTNNGSSWSPVNNGINSNVNTLIISGNNIYAGSGNGVYLSTNGCSTWKVDTTGLNGFYNIQTLAINGNNLITGSYIGEYNLPNQRRVYLSVDSGSSWTLDTTGLNGDYFIQALAISGSNIFAGTPNGFYLSKINGGSWTALNNIGFGVNSLIIKGDTIFASASSEGIGYYSIDNGNSWTSSWQNAYIESFATNGNNIYGTNGEGVYLYSTIGNGWINISSDLPLSNYLLSSIGVNANNFFAGINNMGVYLSTNNGSSWIPMNNGLQENTGQTNSIVFDNVNVYLATNVGIYKQALANFKTESNDVVNISNVLVYPNPMSDIVTVECQGINTADKNMIYIINTTGSIVYQQQLTQDKTQIDISNYSKGVYIIQFRNSTTLESQKMIKD